ncbi:hypothetical protein V8G54_030250 [Vigna mungo]|uniref:Uncharacterized protein n=1 Tax=Vigna mungo TaxID=3915 RepID=A0AAQ3MWP9_VIGMU
MTEQFEQYAGLLKGIEQNYLIGILLNGFKEEIKSEVKLHDPSNLAELMMKAQMVEGKGESVEAVNSLSKTQGINSNGGVAFRKLSDKEMQDKISKGLCFGCDEKLKPNHACRNKQLHMLKTDNDLSSYNKLVNCKGDTEEDVEEDKALQLSMFTMKVWGKIGDVEVLVLLDCGTSHNFISQEVVNRCGLKAKETHPYVVEVGDGHKVHCEGKCTGFVLELQGLNIQQEFLIFYLGGASVVLGLEWLASLGEVKADFGKLKLTIGRGESQRMDHAIHLKEGASILNLSSYKYSHLQKNEIKKQVLDMLKVGIIRPSITPYSSPMILANKRMALNKIIIPTKFPMPVIDVLLDEFARATIFSKLDLKSGLVWNIWVIISGLGISTDPKKVEAMWKWPTSKDTTALRGFLDAQEASNTLKVAISQLPILEEPDFSKPFNVETNAFSKGLGALKLDLVKERRMKLQADNMREFKFQFDITFYCMNASCSPCLAPEVAMLALVATIPCQHLLNFLMEEWELQVFPEAIVLILFGFRSCFSWNLKNQEIVDRSIAETEIAVVTTDGWATDPIYRREKNQESEHTSSSKTTWCMSEEEQRHNKGKLIEKVKKWRNQEEPGKEREILNRMNS